MKTKNKTLTINKKLIPKSKISASLDSETKGFTSKWLGKLSITNEKDARMDNLIRRYGL